MPKQSIKRLTLNRLVPLFVSLMFVIALVIAFNFRSLILLSTEDRAVTIAQMTKAGLTAHMKAGIMDKRDYFLREIAEAEPIKSLKIIRTLMVVQQYGEGNQYEGLPEAATRKVLSTKEPLFMIEEWDSHAVMRAVIPYIATDKGALNCLSCHHVPAGSVLGAVDLEIDVTEYRNRSWHYLLAILAILTIFVALILFNTFRVIEKFVRRPLLGLVELATSLFYRLDATGKDRFDSLEFSEIAEQFKRFDQEIKERQELLKQKNRELSSIDSEIEETLKETLFSMGEAEERRSKETRKHTLRVVEYSKCLGRLAGLSDREIEILVVAAPVHDIGKIGIPDTILHKPGRLTTEEMVVMKMHAQMGYEILRHSERDILRAAAIVAYEHHERWDGTGYPRGLKEKEIHIYGRILAIADVFDALTTRRIYKEAWPFSKVVEHLKEEQGKHFDPHLIALLLENIDQFRAILHRYYDPDNIA